MKVAIFGAGLAGLSAAVGLRAQGHQCRIYERSRQAQDAGMGFILLPEAIASLQSLGVPLDGSWSGVPLEQYICRDSRGEVLREQPLPAGTRAFRRRDLIAALCAPLNGGNGIKFDAELQRVEFSPDGSVKAAALSSGEPVQADLYLAADGGRSRARNAMFPQWPAPAAPVAEVVGMLRCAEAIQWAGGNFNKFHAAGGGLALGAVPVGADHLVWFLQFDVQRFSLPEDSPEARVAFVEKLAGKWADPIPHWLAHTDYSRVHLWRPIDTDLIPQFYRGNLVLVGDAAHPMLPFTSRGVSSAIADVIVLERELHRHRDLEDALGAYSAQRREQCAPYIGKGRELTRNFRLPLSAETAMVPLAL
jgi:2-polyprenyl-6-methoxyphenol hydroxylase-like FAD-dependent oxidoreductase